MNNSLTQNNKPVGVIGAGSFGTAVANLLSYNTDVLLYSRNPDQVDQINQQHRLDDLALNERIRATTSLQQIADHCELIFPIVPSSNFRIMMQEFAPFLHPYHILIHGTKGLDVKDLDEDNLKHITLTRSDVSTMSEIILQESSVVRVGCLSGPNLAVEIHEGQPTATVIGSRFDEVISKGKRVLSSKHFHVFGTHEILGAELAGALKNIIALGSGILKGMGLGKNIQSMLITRGLMEMIYFGKAMGTTASAFVGTAGVGDLIATATSKKSRNYTFGYRFGQGEGFDEIMDTMPELAEGVRTLKICKELAKYYKLRVPITQTLYSVVFEDFEKEKAIEYLITFPYDVDVDFL